MSTEQSTARRNNGKGTAIKKILFARKFYIGYCQGDYK